MRTESGTTSISVRPHSSTSLCLVIVAAYWGAYYDHPNLPKRKEKKRQQPRKNSWNQQVALAVWPEARTHASRSLVNETLRYRSETWA